MTISVNEQVAGHKLTVGAAPKAASGQRQANCQCGWRSRVGGTEQVMPQTRSHLEAALQAAQPSAGRPTTPPTRTPRT